MNKYQKALLILIAGIIDIGGFYLGYSPISDFTALGILTIVTFSKYA